MADMPESTGPEKYAEFRVWVDVYSTDIYFIKRRPYKSQTWTLDVPRQLFYDEMMSKGLWWGEDWYPPHRIIKIRAQEKTDE